MPQRNAKIRDLMLVDDDELDHRIFARVIEQSDVVENFHACIGATDALRRLAAFDAVTNPGIPSVCLVDINMPGLDGFEFVERAVVLHDGRFADIPFVMLTTSLMQRDVQRAQSLEAVRGYLHKPLAVEHLDWLANLVARQDAEATAARVGPLHTPKREPEFNLLSP